MLDLELVPPATVVPEGTVIGVRHFLSVPSCRDVQEAVKGGESCHSILKVSRSMKKKLDIEVVYSEGNISSTYISTDKFQKKPLCQILVAWWAPWGRAECLHSSLKRIVVTKRKGVCSHTPISLALYCLCESAWDEFERKIKMRGQEPTEAVMEQNIEKKSQISYDISVRLAGLVGESEKRSISHLTLCKYNGVKKLEAAIEDKFDCSCDEVHCGRGQQIKMKATEMPKEVSRDSELLLCDMTKTEVSRREESEPISALEQVHLPPDVQIATASTEDKLTLCEIMEEEIPRPHRPGEHLKYLKSMIFQILHNTLPMSLGLVRTLTFGFKTTGIEEQEQG